MPANKLQKVTSGDVNFALQVDTANVRPGVAGIVAQATLGQLKTNPDGTVRNFNPEQTPVVTTAATYSLTAAQNGTTLVIGTSATCTVTLPATEAGLHYRIVCSIAAGSGVGHSISPNASDLITGKGVATPADDKDLINTQASAAVGDAVEVIGDGSLGWYIVSQLGTWTREG